MSRNTLKNRRTGAMKALVVNNPGTGTGGYGDNSIERIYRKNLSKYKETDSRLAEVYPTDLILQQIISVPVIDGLSEWRESSETLKAEEKRLSIKRMVMEAGIAARKSGEALMMPIFVDEQGNKIGLNRSIDNVLDQPGVRIARLMVTDDFESDKNRFKDVLSQFHGRPMRYKINDVAVHGSRVIPFYGTQTKTSVFEGVESYYASWTLGRQDVSKAVQEANFLVLATNIEKLRDIADSKTALGESVEAEDLIEQRARNLRCNANNNNVFVIDKEMEEVTNIQKANIKDMVDAIDQQGQHLAGAADIPISRLLSRQASGLGNSNQADIQNYIQALSGYRFMVLEPSIYELDQLLNKIDGAVTIDSNMKWNPLAIEKYLDDSKGDSKDEHDGDQ